ncbi:MAG: glycoside hydrolase family 2 TIM barrel-domain containing protein [Breznakibacter sp.]
MIRFYFITMLFIQISLFATITHGQGSRETLNMNADWAFFRGEVEGGEEVAINDSSWIATTLPHVMQLEKKHCGGNSIYDGIGWYRRYFTLSPQYKGKRIVLSFEGVMNSCDLFINGKKVANHKGGYIGFVVDATEHINWNGNNLLAVRVSAQHDPLTPPGKPQERMDFYYYSGIYRDVEMIISDKLHITDALAANEEAGGGVFVTYPKVTKEHAIVNVKTHIKNEGNDTRNVILRSTLSDVNGNIIADKNTPIQINNGKAIHIEQSLDVKKPSLWHPYSPHLYTLRSEILENNKTIDHHTQKIGIRTIAFTTEKGFYINGEHLYLRGSNRHQSYANIGDAASNSMQERDVIDIKRSGCNAVRAAHYPQDPAFLDACDRHGLLVIECIPGWQYFNSDSVFVSRLYNIGRQMIRRDRNHPSIVLWETALNESRYPVEIARNLYNIAHTEYPGDQMYTAGDYFGHEEMVHCYDVFYKQVSSFPKDGDVMTNSLEDQIAVKPLFSREWGDGVGEKPRVSLIENEEEQMKQCRGRYEQLNGNGYFDWCMLDANPRMGGHFLWSHNDYARGAEDETMFCGIVDINRYPKFSYYMMQSMRDKDISQPGLYEGPMVFIASYNSSADYTTSTTDITVFSNCDEVRLFRNNRLIGTQTREERSKFYQPIVDKGGSPCFVFNAKSYEAGQLTAEGFINGKKAATHTVRTPETPHHIEFSFPSDNLTPIADGSDMVPVYFKICDKNGTLINQSNTQITLSVSGNGTLIGEGIDRIGIQQQHVEGGIGYALIRTSKQAGKITVTASANGLKSSSKTIRTMPYSGKYVPDGKHAPFIGKEENGVAIKPTTWESQISKKTKVQISRIEATSEQQRYPSAQLTDGDDNTWWIAGNNTMPQTVTLELEQSEKVYALRIRFQKDSSTYTHQVQTSTNGVDWEPLFQRECTGWDFKPVQVQKELKFIRIIIEKSSEGAAGIAEVTVYK